VGLRQMKKIAEAAGECACHHSRAKRTRRKAPNWILPCGSYDFCDKQTGGRRASVSAVPRSRDAKDDDDCVR
jgi:hypothetical protein